MFAQFIAVWYRWSILPKSPFRWRHNERNGVSNHQPHDCLLNRLFRRRSQKSSKLRVTGLCAGNSPGPVNSPHKWPVTRKMMTSSCTGLLGVYCDNAPVLVKQYWRIWVNVPYVSDNTWWCHDMETLSTLLSLYDGNPPMTKDLWWGNLMFSLLL